MQTNKTTYIKVLVSISLLVLVFHFLILFKIIPYTIAWGGRLQTDDEMYVFEIISIVINAFFIYVLLQCGNFVKSIFNKKTIAIILWGFFGMFVLNTIGNVFSHTNLEKSFTLLTLCNSYLVWKINKANKLSK